MNPNILYILVTLILFLFHSISLVLIKHDYQNMLKNIF